MLSSMRHETPYGVVVTFLATTASIPALFAIYRATNHESVAVPVTITAALLIVAFLILLYYLGIRPLCAWGQVWTRELYVSLEARSADQQRRMAALKTAPLTADDPDRIEILKAVYAGQGGSDDQLAERVRGLLSGDGHSLSFIVCNEVLGAGDPSYDPAPNSTKTLTLTFRLGGREYPPLTVVEGQKIDLP
jgi:hypothetical protein